MASEEAFSPQKKIRRRSAWFGPLALALLFLIVMLVLSLFFRVSDIEVINASEYTDEEIIRASGIDKGANLFFVDRFKAASMIFSDLPYMDTVSVRRQLPGRIIIQAEGSAPVAYMKLEEEYWLLDRRGNMLGTVSQTDAEAHPEIRGLEPLTAIAGTEMIVEGENEARLAYYVDLLTPLQAEGMLPYIQWIDLRTSSNPTLRLDNRILVYLGPREAVDYKIAQLRDVTEKLSRDDTGTLSFAGGNTWTFSPD